MKAWLTKHARIKLHFTPTSASWLDLVERFFAAIARKRIRRGAFGSVAELEAAIFDDLNHHNTAPKPFVWTKSATTILEKERRALDALEAIKTRYQALELGTLDLDSVCLRLSERSALPEPPRLSRRLFGLDHAAIAGVSSKA